MKKENERKTKKANGFHTFFNWIQSRYEESEEYIKNTNNEKNILNNGGRDGFKK